MTDEFDRRFHFSPANRLRIGVEEEVWTVSPKTGVLVPMAPRIFTDGYEKKYPFLKPALPAQMIEAATPFCRSMNDVNNAIRANAMTMVLLSRSRGFKLSRDPVPTKPHSISVFPSPHFLDIAQRVGERLGSVYAASMRAHVGVGNREEAVLAMNVLRKHLPSLLAQSARSRHTHDGIWYASYRYAKYQQIAGTVVPPILANWKSFETAAERGGFHDDPSKCWWGLRINPLGTVEVRIFDVQNNIGRILSLVALTRMLVRAALDHQLKPEPISPGTIEDWLGMASRNVWNVRDFREMALELSNNRQHKEDAPYVRRLFP